MEPVSSTAGIAEEIRLSIAPVFLLTGIAGMVAILSTRLTTVTERAVSLQAQQFDSERPVFSQPVLNSRLRLLDWSIRLFLLSALQVCLVIISLFLGDYVAFDLSGFISAAFIVTMLTLIIGLGLFVCEVHIAARQTRLELDRQLAARK